MSVHPCFWYAGNASQAFKTYAEAFSDAELTLDNGFLFELTFNGTKVAGMNGGARYKPNVSVSAFVELPTIEAVDAAFARLNTDTAEVKMPLGAYDWSERFAWITDEWGVSWQLVYTPSAAASFSAAVMFFGDNAGRARAAMEHYKALLPDTRVLTQLDFPEDATQNPGGLMHAQLASGTSKMILCDSNPVEPATFTPGGSLMLPCTNQEEIDRYWSALTAQGGAAGRCGWCTDRFGVSWQVYPAELAGWLSNPRTAKQVGERLQQMDKIEMGELAPTPTKWL